MNQQDLAKMWDQMRSCHGITMRLIESIPADQLDSHPIENMRTPKELVVHMYSLLQGVGEGIAQGAIKPGEEKPLLAGIKDRDGLLEYARSSWNAADKGVSGTTDGHLQATVQTPWDLEFPGHFGFTILRDEYLHHRGQLYAFARALGAEPPMMWDFGNNAPEYRPKEQAKV